MTLRTCLGTAALFALVTAMGMLVPSAAPIASASPVVDATNSAAHSQLPPRFTSREQIVDGLTYRTFTVALADGATARGDLVRIAPRPTLRVEPVHADGTIVGTQPTSTMARDHLAEGALAAVNGGFWLPAAGGKPHGVAAADRTLLAGPRTQWGNPGHRGTLGVRADGSTVFTRLGGRLGLRRADGRSSGITDLNYVPLEVGGDGSGELLLYTPDWGGTVAVPRRSKVATLNGLTLPVLGSATADVSTVDITSGTVTIPDEGGVLVGYGRSRRKLGDLAPGGQAVIDVEIDPLDVPARTWVESLDALPGGPLIVRNRQMTDPDEWKREGFPHDRHNGPRHPRTAVARTGNGAVLLVTVDGRQAHSVGMTMWELAELLLDLHAVHGLSLDGGGSTTMTVLGEVRNRFSDPVERPVANALVARYRPDLPVRDPASTACRPAAVPDATFEDLDGDVHASAITCAAWYGIASGIDASTYAPRRVVTRGQMASFIARTVDHVAAHPGHGAADASLPAAPLEFTDVRPSSPHARPIARLAAAGILTGGPAGLPPSQYGPRMVVTRGQMASMLDRTLDLVRGARLPRGSNVFADDNGTVHEPATNRLAAAGVVQGKTPGMFAPHAPVRRNAMASFVMRAIEGLVADGATTPPG